MSALDSESTKRRLVKTTRELFGPVAAQNMASKVRLGSTANDRFVAALAAAGMARTVEIVDTDRAS